MGIRIWLTVLFLLVTAFAGVTAYEVVRLMFFDTLDQASAQSFAQVGEQFESELRQNPDLTTERIQDFAIGHGLQWGIVRASDGQLLKGKLENWNAGVVQEAVSSGEPAQERNLIRGGVRDGQLLATYAAPINVAGEQQTAIVFTDYFTKNDIENVPAVVGKVEHIALLAGALALLITGVAGYVAADLIARRVSRLGLAADRLAAGNFDERIGTQLEDEIGSLGATFNSMATSLKGAFRQVEQEKERGEAILDGMTDAVVGVDDNLNPVFLNPRARELLDSPDRDFQNRLQEVLARTSVSGPVTEPEVEVATESGSRFIEIRAAPLEEGALAILRDVTREHQISRAKSEFIANASHELKTPLSALSGYLEMLGDEDDEEVRQAFLDDMRAQTERLQNLARTLLDLSRLDADAITFRDEEVDLEDTLHALRRDFGYTGRTIDVKTEENAQIETDPTQLHRMLAILVDNALKYSPQDAPVELGLSRSDGHATVSVTDYGCGIPEDEIPNIFERFYRAQGSTRADGTGLGLALAGEIASHLDGEIGVESHPGEGSTFSVRLPAR